MLRIITSEEQEVSLFIVVSAMGKTTNTLETLLECYWKKIDCTRNLDIIKHFFVEICQDLFENPQDPMYEILEETFTSLKNTLRTLREETVFDKVYDQIVSYGELISSKIIAHFLESRGLSVQWMDARQLIRTNSSWREAEIDWPKTHQAIRELVPWSARKIIITQGFIGGNPEGQCTTLGREGSDFSAAIFACGLPAQELVIWKDVPGVLNADPKRVPNAQLYQRLSYQEAAEMCKHGARVIHPKTIAPLATHKIPLLVKSFIHPEEPGTFISESPRDQFFPMIVFKGGQWLLSFEVDHFDFLTEAHLLEVVGLLCEHKIKVNLLHKTPTRLTACVDGQPHRVEALLEGLPETFSYTLRKNLELISIKYANADLHAQLTLGKDVLLTEKSQELYQAVVQE